MKLILKVWFLPLKSLKYTLLSIKCKILWQDRFPTDWPQRTYKNKENKGEKIITVTHEKRQINSRSIQWLLVSFQVPSPGSTESGVGREPYASSICPGKAKLTRELWKAGYMACIAWAATVYSTGRIKVIAEAQEQVESYYIKSS
jgi:hypothetical protein